MNTLSKDLLPIYELELQLGNQVARIDSPAGTLCPYAVVFRDPLHLEEIGKRLKLAGSVTKWSNDDPHYPLETGFRSSASKHAIAGPTAGSGKPGKS
jgi:hypothetical protein